MRNHQYLSHLCRLALILLTNLRYDTEVQKIKTDVQIMVPKVKVVVPLKGIICMCCNGEAL